MVFRSISLALALGASTLAFSPAFAEPLKVVASFSILGDMVKEIGGKDVAVTTLVGPNGDAHVYEPTPQDAKALGEAKVLVENGLNMEGWLPRLVKTSGFSGETVIASTGVKPRELTPEEQALEAAEEAHDHGGEAHAEADHDHDHVDPHAWQDLKNGEIYAKNIAAGLAKADPEHAKDYLKRGDAYIAEMKVLDEKVRAEINQVPENQRLIVTSHDAFGYFGQAYHVKFIAPQGVSTEAEASAQDVAKIIDQIRAQHIRAVFVENISNPRLIEQISRETKAKVGGSLFSDALSPSNGPAPTYLDMFRNNADQIVKALKTS
ncbi:metal ABC transporter substrate-binding protein [Aureimonas ureilytica]|uniref:Metal ABC transporter substrate-binding protein n=1 Tax=Aureimonas ureilytica TaxID=401562 RepID=A0A175RUS7_9HYPH|nr:MULTISPECIES: metal ABC transporter substrate-binding protein [Aureimonas]KTR06599.1 metal ABC transporter substrate-binding protein [Aureimonas ureilytica]